MKKILAAILALLLVLSMTAVFAEEPEIETGAKEYQATATLTKDDDDDIPTVHSVTYTWATTAASEIHFKDKYIWDAVNHAYTLKKNQLVSATPFQFTLTIVNNGNVEESFEVSFEAATGVTAETFSKEITVDTMAPTSLNRGEYSTTKAIEDATEIVKGSITITAINFEDNQASATGFILGTLKVSLINK